MNLGHRLRIAEVEALERENTDLRRQLATLADDEIDLRDETRSGEHDAVDAVTGRARVPPR